MGTERNGQASVRVLVLSDETLYDLGVRSLLSRYPTLEILSCEPDADKVTACLQSFQPDIVVLNTAQQQVANAAEWLQILRDSPRIKLLGLSLEDSTVCIYHGETQQVREAGDLFRAIEGSRLGNPSAAASQLKSGEDQLDREFWRPSAGPQAWRGPDHSARPQPAQAGDHHRWVSGIRQDDAPQPHADRGAGAAQGTDHPRVWSPAD